LLQQIVLFSFGLLFNNMSGVTPPVGMSMMHQKPMFFEVSVDKKEPIPSTSLPVFDEGDSTRTNLRKPLVCFSPLSF
jgi:hypothetical protein